MSDGISLNEDKASEIRHRQRMKHLEAVARKGNVSLDKEVKIKKSRRSSKPDKDKAAFDLADLKAITLQQQSGVGGAAMSPAAAFGLPSKVADKRPPRTLPPEYQALLPEPHQEEKGIVGMVGEDEDALEKEVKKKSTILLAMGIPSFPTFSKRRTASKDRVSLKLSWAAKDTKAEEEGEQDEKSTDSIMGQEDSEDLRRQLELSAQRILQRRISFHVRRRRSERTAAMAGGVAQGRPPRGRPCYFTEGHVRDDEARDVNAEPTPYWVPPAEDELCFRLINAEWKREEREMQNQQPVAQHHTLRSRRSLDLLKRLHIPREPDDPSTLTPGILEIDPDYYSIVEGRPENTATRGRDSVRSYLEDIRNVLKTRLMIGYAQDHMLMVKEQYTQEMRIIKEIHNMNQQHVKAFEEFLAEDHQKSMEILQHADRMATETQSMDAEVKSLNRQLGKIRCELYVLEEHWRTVKNLQRFLYAASPAAWRMQHDHDFMQRQRESGSISSDDFHTESTTTREVRSDMNLNDLIALFNMEVEGEPPPQLYFKSPKDLLDVFENITQLNMDMMTHSEQVRKPLDELYHTLNEARKRMAQDTERMRVTLEEQHARIDWEKRRAAELEADARRVLDDVFKDLIIDDEVIQTLVCVEDTHEACVGVNDSNLTVIEMMRNIERKYEVMMNTLDLYPPNLLAEVERDVNLDEKIRMVRANVAAKQLVAIRRLEDRMHKALQTPPPAGVRALVFRSPPFVTYVKRMKEERKLSPAEKKMLLHLTEWCPQTDKPEPFLEELRRIGMLEEESEK